MTTTTMLRITLLLTLTCVDAHRIRLRPDADPQHPYSSICWDAPYTNNASLIQTRGCDSWLPERQTGWTVPPLNKGGEITFSFPNVDSSLCVQSNGALQPLTLATCTGAATQQFNNASGSTTSGHHYIQQSVGGSTYCVQISANHTAGEPPVLGYCSSTPGQPIEQQQRWENTFGVQPDVRVAKAVGKNGALAVRLSVIDEYDSPARFPDFDYSKAFQKNWKGLWLSSSLKGDAVAGTNTWAVGDARLRVRVPAAGSGVRGIFFGDPSNGPVGAWGSDCHAASQSCPYGEGLWQVKRTLPAVLNLMQDPLLKDPSEAVDFIGILGDNFYDQCGDNTADFFSRLQTPVKTTLLVTCPGNHDYWIPGGPSSGPSGYECPEGTPGAGEYDQFANGFMQYYGQDTLAATPSAPYDFTADADYPQVAKSSNFFSYYTIGNVGMITFSNAASWTTLRPSFEEACSYFDKVKPDHVLALSHWSMDNLGSVQPDSAPEITQKIQQSFPGCASAVTMFGHSHCQDEDFYTCTQAGLDNCYLIGATGMGDGACEAHWGFVYLDSTGADLQLWEFRLGDTSSDRSGPLLDCLRTSGLGGCTGQAYKQWTTTPYGANTTKAHQRPRLSEEELAERMADKDRDTWAYTGRKPVVEAL